VNIGVGYAISSNQIQLCLPELRAGLIVQHGTLNATVRSVDDPTWPGGVRVTFDRMLAPGAAHDAGILVGDALLEFMGARIEGVNEFSRLIAVLPQGRRVSLKLARYEDGGWKEKAFTLNLDGIPLVGKEDAAQKKPPQVYLDYEVDRTFAAARKAVQPRKGEVREGVMTVRDREPRPFKETFGDGTVTQELGDRVRTATPEGGTEGEGPLDPDYRADLLEELAAWNDLARPDARLFFEKVAFTGGALVNGVTADRMEVKTKDGAERVYFLHLGTGRPLRIDVYSRRWAQWVSLVHDDWRDAGGLLRPYKVTVWNRDKESLVQTWEYTAIRKS
jgi:hypothetical protein